MVILVHSQSSFNFKTVKIDSNTLLPKYALLDVLSAPQIEAIPLFLSKVFKTILSSIEVGLML